MVSHFHRRLAFLINVIENVTTCLYCIGKTVHMSLVSNMSSILAYQMYLLTQYTTQIAQMLQSIMHVQLFKQHAYALLQQVFKVTIQA